MPHCFIRCGVQLIVQPLLAYGYGLYMLRKTFVITLRTERAFHLRLMLQDRITFCKLFRTDRYSHFDVLEFPILPTPRYIRYDSLSTIWLLFFFRSTAANTASVVHTVYRVGQPNHWLRKSDEALFHEAGYVRSLRQPR